MFLNLECEVNTEQVMIKMLENHSLHYVLWLALKTYGYENYEYLADKITKTVEEASE